MIDTCVIEFSYKDVWLYIDFKYGSSSNPNWVLASAGSKRWPKSQNCRFVYLFVVARIVLCVSAYHIPCASKCSRSRSRSCVRTKWYPSKRWSWMLKSICTLQIIYSFSTFQCFCSFIWIGFVGAADVVVVLFLPNGQKNISQNVVEKWRWEEGKSEEWTRTPDRKRKGRMKK